MNLDQVFQTDRQTTEDANTIYLKGELGLAKASEFNSIIDPYVADTNRKLVIDMENLKYIDSTGIGIILTVLKTRHALKAPFAVERIPPKIQKLFDITGMTPFLVDNSNTDNKKDNIHMNLLNRTVYLTLPAEAEFIDLVRLTLYGVSSRLGFSYEEIEDMKVAVSEACNNVVVHAYEPGQSGLMEVQFEAINGGICIHIKDSGKRFDFEEKISGAASLHDKSLSEVKSGGLGLYLMQALMDDVQVKGDEGTEVILTKMVSKSEEMV